MLKIINIFTFKHKYVISLVIVTKSLKICSILINKKYTILINFKSFFYFNSFINFSHFLSGTEKIFMKFSNDQKIIL